MNFRCLRAANRGLYLGMSLLVLGVCIYAFLQGERPAWQQTAAAAAGLLTLIWGGYYALLRYQVDAMGVSRYSFFSLRARILWEELEAATLEQQESMGTARCTLHLRACDGRSLTLSSDLLPLDELLELAEELQQQGYLPPQG